MLIVENMDAKQRQEFESQISSGVTQRESQDKRLRQIERERQAELARQAATTN